MLVENKTIGRNRKEMKVEWEFYRRYKAFEVLPRITLWWGCGPIGVDFSWLRWAVDIEFSRDNNACR